MLIRHSAIYFFGRIIPGVVSLLTLALFTRMMTTEQYGHYALVITAVGILNATCFQWLGLGVGRLLPANEGDPVPLLSTALTAFGLLVAGTAVLGGIVAMFWPDASLRGLVFLAVIVGWSQAWFDLNLKITNTRLAPVRYGFVSAVKALLSVSIGLALLSAGFGVAGVLIGLVAGFLVSTAGLWKQWRGISIRHRDERMLKDFLAYGAPLTLTLILTLILDVSDRFLLNWFMSAEAVGAYSSAYDLTQQSLGMIMGVVHLAAFPLALRAFEEKGEDAARDQLKSNVLMLLAISIPATVGLITLAENIADVMLGAGFRENARHIIIVIALAIFVGGMKSYYFDYSFQLGRKMTGQVWAVLAAAIANVGFNLWWIPIYGVLGAAYATLGGFIVALGVSWYLGRKVFPVPALPREAYKVVLAALGMAVVLYYLSNWRGLAALLGQVLLGAGVYTLLLLVFDVGQSRVKFSRYLG